MEHLEFRRLMDAPESVIWNVITDHELYAEAAPNLTSVEVIEGEEETMVRRCIDTDGNAWTETCTTWNDGERFAVEVDVANSGFHRSLFNRFRGQWGLDTTPDGPEVTIRIEYDTKYGPFGRLISAYLAYKAPGLIEAIFDRWEAEIEARMQPTDFDQRPGQTTTNEGQTNALYP